MKDDPAQKEDPDLAEALFRRVTEFSITYIEMLKLKALKKFTEIISAIIPDVMISILILIILLFLNLGLAFWLGDLLGEVYSGFLLVAGFYFFMGLIIHFLFRGQIKKVSANYFIRQFFKQN